MVKAKLQKDVIGYANYGPNQQGIAQFLSE